MKLNTEILLFHPTFAKSKANRALLDTIVDVPGLRVTDMQALYPTGQFDLDVEANRLIQADRIVLQFPIQWYSTPPLLKAWQDALLTRMFYINPDKEGVLLKGKPLLVACTAGNKPEAYSPEGINLFPLPELLKPLHSTANRCGLRWMDPFIIYNATATSAEELRKAGTRYAARISGSF